MSSNATITAQNPVDELLEFYLSPIHKLMKLPGVENIFVNRFDEILYEQFGKTKVWQEHWKDESELNNAVNILANRLDQPISPDEPLLDAVMPDGARLNSTLPPVTPNTTMSIRVFPEERIDADKLVEFGSMTRQMYQFLKLAVLTKRNIVTSGGTGAGKSTIVQMLHDEIPSDRRLVIIEDTRELKGREFNCLQMEAPKRRNDQGLQLVTMGRLIINGLRQTPESLIIGEIRDGEAASAYRTGLNTGHSGVITTLHADSAEDAIDRLRDLVQEKMATTPSDVIVSGLQKSLNIVIHAEKTLTDGKRTVAIGDMQDGELRRVFEWDYINSKHITNKEVLAASPIWNMAKRFKLDLSWMDDEFKPYIKA